jgi:hypothetical protein
MKSQNNSNLVRISRDEIKRLQKIDHEVGVLRRRNKELERAFREIMKQIEKLEWQDNEEDVS